MARQSILCAALALSTLAILPAIAASQSSEITGGSDDIEFVSGGVGRTERAQLLESAGGFNLFVSFARKADGAYLSAVNVRVEAPADGPSIELTTEGPLLLVSLPAGDYTLTAELPGWQLARRSLSIGEGSLHSVYIAMEPQLPSPP
jgi:hypothetical protein